MVLAEGGSLDRGFHGTACLSPVNLDVPCSPITGQLSQLPFEEAMHKCGDKLFSPETRIDKLLPPLLF